MLTHTSSTIQPGGGGRQFPLEGGHHARSWTFKKDPKQVTTLHFYPPLTSPDRSYFPTLDKYFNFKTASFQNFAYFGVILIRLLMYIDVHRPTV